VKAVDLFAGAGGATLGLTRAGLDVVWAANHWGSAVKLHSARHPGVEHEQQDLQQADFSTLPLHDVLWASPACQGHSQAASGGGRHERRGRAPVHDYLRSTAWAAVTAAEVNQPEVAVIENVTSFRRWPLYAAWRSAWEALGYALSEHVVNSAGLGVPQDRERLFVVAVQGETPLDLPLPQTEGRKTLADVMDDRGGRWSRVSRCRSGVQRRVRQSIEARGYSGAFFTQSVSGHKGRGLDRPAPTVTTKHQMGWVRGRGRWDRREYRPWTVAEYERAMGFPEGYVSELEPSVTTSVKLLGNAVVPAVARWLGEQIVSRV